METDTIDRFTTIPVATLLRCNGTSTKSGPDTERSKRIAFLVGVLGEAFRQKISATTIEAYRIGLADLDATAIERAVQAAIRSCKFMPFPSELRELAGETRPDDRAVLAFAVLESAVIKYGGYRSPDFDDPMMNATVRALGGWERICEMPVAEFDKWFRQDFIKTYAALSRTGVNGDLTAPMVGYFERQNARLGYHRPEDRVTVRSGLPWAGEVKRRLRGDDTTGPPTAKLLQLRSA